MRKRCGLLLWLVVCLSLNSALSQSHTLLFIEYGLKTCPACIEQTEILKDLQKERGIPFIYVELLGNETNVLEYIELYDALIGGEKYVPLVIIVIEGEVKAALVGVYAANELLDIAEKAKGITGILVVSSGTTREVTNATVIEKIRKIIKSRLANIPVEKTAEKVPLVTFREAISLMIPLAAADSVNPCTFAVFTALLLMVLALRGRKSLLPSALAFILAIYVCYYLLGLGLVKALALFPPSFPKLIAAAGIIVGVISLLANLWKGFVTPVPARLKKITEAAIYRATGPLGAASLGALCSFTLLPCSSGPYIVFISILSRLQRPELSYLLLGLYNAIFVAPLLALALATIALKLTAKKIKEMRSERTLKVMEITASALLIAVCLYILMSSY